MLETCLEKIISRANQTIGMLNINTVSQLRQRVSLVRIPWKMSCTHVGSLLVLGEIDPLLPDVPVFNDAIGLLHSVLLVRTFPKLIEAVDEPLTCLRSAVKIQEKMMQYSAKQSN